MSGTFASGRWQRHGRIFEPEQDSAWMHSHAANPFAVERGRLHRVYFSSRDAEKRSSIGWVDVDLGTRRIAEVAREPVLSAGEPGLFDDSGCSLGCLIPNDSGSLNLYYVGWNLAVTVPWRNSIGLAVGPQDGPFERVAPAPVLDRSEVDPLSLSYPWVLRDGDLWRMWYGSNTSWGRGSRDIEHVIKYAESQDGRRWRATGQVCIGVRDDESFALARPCVVQLPGGYVMWYSARGSRYRIDAAESADGLVWTPLEQAGLRPSGDSGWDGQDVCYPHVFCTAGTYWLLYCGNGYGATGFGVATWEPSAAR